MFPCIEWNFTDLGTSTGKQKSQKIPHIIFSHIQHLSGTFLKIFLKSVIVSSTFVASLKALHYNMSDVLISFHSTYSN